VREKQVQFQEDSNRPSNHISHVIPNLKICPENVFVTTRAARARKNKSDQNTHSESSEGGNEDIPNLNPPKWTDNEFQEFLKLKPRKSMEEEREIGQQPNPSTENLLPQKVIMPSKSMPTIAHAILPSFYQTKKNLNEVKLPKRKIQSSMKLAMGLEPYDVLANLDKIQPQISMKQLLAISPKC